jgi:lipopolysaccharide transport system ATP-binding protein
MTLAIRATRLSKQYRLGERATYRTFRDALLRTAMAPWRAIRPAAPEPDRTLHALREVSFDVHAGEVVGIIGRNGAGKSTLLKILSRITDPSDGEADLFGRVGSLLEVGTGFHPELTGRENVFLNGAVLGMRKAEIAAKFDQIVAFSEIERFIDTPVKRYSSGMYMRLAFAVAAHLEPEILIVDEVLAVGDAAFQRKCLGAMGQVARSGRTVLFVSHNMAAVQALCSRCILLDRGVVAHDGPTPQVVAAYLHSLEVAAAADLEHRTDRAGRGNIRLTDLAVTSDPRLRFSALRTGEPATFTFTTNRPNAAFHIVLGLYDEHGHLVCDLDSRRASPRDHGASTRGATFHCHLDTLMLVPGRYRANVALLDGDTVEDHVEGALVFDVEEGVLGGRPIPAGTRGSLAMSYAWDFLPGAATQGAA